MVLEQIEKMRRRTPGKVLEAADIANAIVYAVAQPKHVAINEILVRPSTSRPRGPALSNRDAVQQTYVDNVSTRVEPSVTTNSVIATHVIVHGGDRERRDRDRVSALREAMDLSLRDLAERSGVSAPMLSQVERGETSPTLAVAERIAAGLDLTLSQLLAPRRGASTSSSPRPASAARRERSGHRTEELTPPLPGQRADVSLHALEPGRRDRAGRATRRCTSPARARPRSSSRARSAC